MPSKRRYTHVPKESGWIVIRDSWKRFGGIDCTQGGAQKAFEDLCTDFARAGWELEERKFDYRFVRKGKLRWEISIAANPFKDVPMGSFVYMMSPRQL